MHFQSSGGRPPGHHQQELVKDSPINHTLFVTLEEIYSGTVKRMRITKKILDASGRTTQVSIDKEITVKPGWKDGTKITFEREGDEVPGKIPADIIFTLQTKPHDRFSREGDDLLHKMNVSLSEALGESSSSLAYLRIDINTSDFTRNHNHVDVIYMVIIMISMPLEYAIITIVIIAIIIITIIAS